jgi:hypothetical protein
MNFGRTKTFRPYQIEITMIFKITTVLANIDQYIPGILQVF